MDSTLFIAQLFGTTLLVVSIAMGFRHKDMLTVLDDFLKDRALLFFGALISLMSGLFIVLIHNVWNGDFLTTVVTILGWLLVLRGIMWLFVPNGALRKLVRSVKRENTYFAVVFIIFVVGAYLALAGFSA